MLNKKTPEFSLRYPGTTWDCLFIALGRHKVKINRSQTHRVCKRPESEHVKMFLDTHTERQYHQQTLHHNRKVQYVMCGPLALVLLFSRSDLRLSMIQKPLGEGAENWAHSRRTDFLCMASCEMTACLWLVKLLGSTQSMCCNLKHMLSISEME